MSTMGTCSKCGQLKTVVQHHYKGYNTDETKPYCYSCDQKAHYKARSEGKCLLTHKEAGLLSKISSNKARAFKFLDYMRVESNISIKTVLSINTRTNTITINVRKEYRPIVDNHASYGEMEF